AHYKNFAYSADLASSRVDRIVATNGNTTLGVIVRDVDNSMDIYSIKTRNGYNAHNNNANNMLKPVKLLQTYVVTEKYVDEQGQKIAEDSVAFVEPPAFQYQKQIPSLDGYDVVGYAVGDYTAGHYTESKQIEIDPVVAHQIVHFVYRKHIPKATFTISKQVVGEYADTQRAFDFTLYFRDEAGIPLPKDSIISYSVDDQDTGQIILDDEGKVLVALAHGQSITIEEILVGTQVRIIEETSPRYATVYHDSEQTQPGMGGDTGYLVIAEDMRTFDFVNTREQVVISGAEAVSPTVSFLILLIILSTSLIALNVITPRTFHRKEG
ncbi:MAG: hypothetical protein FWE87_02105, partial [Coriobacteriia bacterium]|nr:hypothetical protein [Coriobacteriia bacterium]